MPTAATSFTILPSSSKEQKFMTVVENERPFGSMPANGALPVNVPDQSQQTATVFSSATMSSSLHRTSGKLERIIATTLM